MFLVAVVLASVGCKRGGVELTGSQRVPAPEVPADARRWLNGKVKLAELKGKVVLVEAWHPS
jgi:hypothetical protein